MAARSASTACRRFNEAAGIPRGRLQGVFARVLQEAHASMRPRVFPAEDMGRAVTIEWPLRLELQ